MTLTKGLPSGGRRYFTSAVIAALIIVPFAGAHAQHEQHTPQRPDSSKQASQAGDSAQSAEHDMGAMMAGPLGVSHERMGSGTTWMPDTSPMHANHKMWGDWTIMLHGVAFGQYDYQGSKRGDSQLGIVDWEMVMAMRSIGRGKLHLHGMVSLEPLTLGGRGYPLLLQTGESYKGEPLFDRQHPHDAVMELAAMFQQPIAKNLAIELYGGLAGEPALGPVAFMHRPSAQSDPLAPLGHHWQDATHISFGVLTAGLYSRTWKIEGSAFNGREPDENRWNLDLRRIDSYSGRVTVNPLPEWSFSGWYGFLESPEELHPDESVHRYGVSALHGGRGYRGGTWSNTLMLAANAHGGHTQTSALGETNFEIGSRNSLFARAEYVQKSVEDLVLPGLDPERQFDVKSLVVGYMREIQPIRGGTIGIGGRVSVNFIPDAVGKFYGTRAPKGIDVYVRIRPRAMVKHDMEQMRPMKMDHSDHAVPLMRQPTPATHMMAHDSSMHRDSVAMHHDSSAVHHDHMMTPAKSAAAPAGKTGSVVKTRTAVTKSRTTKTAVKKKAVVKKKPVVKKAVVTKKPVAKKKPAADPHAGHDMKDMKGMPMKPDTSRRKE